jgi:PAS domain-containing protein
VDTSTGYPKVGTQRYYIVFASFASLVTWFSAVRRRVEGELRQARDDLEIEVAERTQQVSLLNLTHDTIFVRDMSDVITYWNRGAQELYGWTAKEAIGKRAHEFLQAVLPAPVEEIRAELLHSGRWDGETSRWRELQPTPTLACTGWQVNCPISTKLAKLSGALFAMEIGPAM